MKYLSINFAKICSLFIFFYGFVFITYIKSYYFCKLLLKMNDRCTSKNNIYIYILNYMYDVTRKYLKYDFY